jgi:hypothetical protein
VAAGSHQRIGPIGAQKLGKLQYLLLMGAIVVGV